MRATKADHDAILAVCGRLGAAHDAKDIKGILSCYAPGARIFDMAPPLESRGLDADTAAAWHDAWIEPPQFDARNVDIMVEGSLAFMIGVHRIRGTKKTGECIDQWFRVTTCFQKIDGQWLIIHDHSSVPVPLDGSYRAAGDLNPAENAD